MPGSDTKNLTEVEKWKIYAEVCKWTDQKTGKIVNNGIERIIEGVKVENIKVKERTVKKIKQAVDEFRRQGKPADLSQKDKEGRRSLLTGDLKDKYKVCQPVSQLPWPQHLRSWILLVLQEQTEEEDCVEQRLPRDG